MRFHVVLRGGKKQGYRNPRSHLVQFAIEIRASIRNEWQAAKFTQLLQLGMKIKLFVFLLPLLLLWGCSKESPSAGESKRDKESTAVTPTTRPQLRMVRAADTFNRTEIEMEAFNLLYKKDYQGLDALAARHRASQEGYADGTWKLGYVYAGLEADLGKRSSDIEWSTRIAELEAWTKTNPESATARIAKARVLVSYAWHIRGAGWADTVKETQWKRFSEQLQAAAATLRAAGQIQERCPLYWSTWQKVGLGLQMDKDDYNKLFAAATKEFPDYWYYHSARAIYLLPRWYGEEGEWERELTIAADRIGGATGDMIYAQTVWSTQQYGDGINVFEGRQISWERVDKGFAELLKKFPKAESAKNERTLLAGLAGDKTKARDYFQQLKSRAAIEVWDEKSKVLEFQNWVLSP